MIFVKLFMALLHYFHMVSPLDFSSSYFRDGDDEKNFEETGPSHAICEEWMRSTSIARGLDKMVKYSQQEITSVSAEEKYDSMEVALRVSYFSMAFCWECFTLFCVPVCDDHTSIRCHKSDFDEQ